MISAMHGEFQRALDYNRGSLLFATAEVAAIGAGLVVVSRLARAAEGEASLEPTPPR